MTNPVASWLMPGDRAVARPRLVALGGDGIGVEVTDAAVAAIRATGAELDVVEPANGERAVAAGGEAFSEAALRECESAGVVLFGAAEKTSVPILRYLRRLKESYANLRPASAFLPGARNDRVDMVIVRENTEGMYPAREGTLTDLVRRWPELADSMGRTLPDEGAFAVRVVTPNGSRRIGRYAARLAAHRKQLGVGRGHVTIVTKSNVLRQTDGLFRECCRKEIDAVGGLEVRELFVDEAARQLVANPEVFDVMVTTNLFGDILSDVVGEMAGGVPSAPSASIGDDFAYFEPVHGSGPDISGQDVANPTGAMLSAAMALEYLRLPHAARRIAQAIDAVLRRDIRTRDRGGSSGTRAFTDAVCAEIASSR